MDQSKKKLVGLVVIVLLAIAAGGTAVYLNGQQNEPADSGNVSTPADTTSNTPTPPADTGEETAAVARVAEYKDGVYSADGRYRTPGGTETIAVTVTLSGDVITDVAVEMDGRGDSKHYQSLFKQGIGALTEGKDVDEVKVSRVSGSSLTSVGFNAALETIKNDARA